MFISMKTLVFSHSQTLKYRIITYKSCPCCDHNKSHVSLHVYSSCNIPFALIQPIRFTSQAILKSSEVSCHPQYCAQIQSYENRQTTKEHALSMHRSYVLLRNFHHLFHRNKVKHAC